MFCAGGTFLGCSETWFSQLLFVGGFSSGGFVDSCKVLVAECFG